MRELAAERSGNLCERCGLARAVHLHHRLLRDYGNHTVQNALHVCARCHLEIHAHPAEAYVRGWLIAPSRSCDLPTQPDCDPGECLVFYRGEKVRLSTDGFVLLQS